MENFRDITDNIAKNIRTLREGKGLTQKKLSEMSGISLSTLSAIERGTANNICIDKLCLLAKALGVGFTTVIYGDSYKDDGRECVLDIDEDLCVAELRKKFTDSTYYPPISKEHGISSFLELVAVLPLLNISDLYGAIDSAVAGGRLDCDILSERLDECWENAPDSAAKKYVNDELLMIRSRREGSGDSIDGDEHAGREALREIIEKRRTVLDSLAYCAKEPFL